MKWKLNGSTSHCVPLVFLNVAVAVVLVSNTCGGYLDGLGATWAEASLQVSIHRPLAFKTAVTRAEAEPVTSDAVSWSWVDFFRCFCCAGAGPSMTQRDFFMGGPSKSPWPKAVEIDAIYGQGMITVAILATMASNSKPWPILTEQHHCVDDS